MKRCFFKLLFLCTMLATASTAWALPTYTVDSGVTTVGSQDTLLASTDMGTSGDRTEIGWVESVLQVPTITFDSKYGSQPASWEPTDGGGLWALNLMGNPDYFLIKTGNNRINGLDTYLFKNNDDFSWAVIDLNDIYCVVGVSKISHLDEFGSSVPEPGTMVLLGSGLLGLAIWGKRRKRE